MNKDFIFLNLFFFPPQTKTRAWPTTLTRLPRRAGAGGGSRRRAARFPLAANRTPCARPRRRLPTKRAPRTYVRPWETCRVPRLALLLTVASPCRCVVAAGPLASAGQPRGRRPALRLLPRRRRGERNQRDAAHRQLQESGCALQVHGELMRLY